MCIIECTWKYCNIEISMTPDCNSHTVDVYVYCVYNVYYLEELHIIRRKIYEELWKLVRSLKDTVVCFSTKYCFLAVLYPHKLILASTLMPRSILNDPCINNLRTWMIWDFNFKVLILHSGKAKHQPPRCCQMENILTFLHLFCNDKILQH